MSLHGHSRGKITAVRKMGDSGATNSSIHRGSATQELTGADTPSAMTNGIGSRTICRANQAPPVSPVSLPRRHSLARFAGPLRRLEKHPPPLQPVGLNWRLERVFRQL